jgi:hypothetical protein
MHRNSVRMLFVATDTVNLVLIADRKRPEDEQARVDPTAGVIFFAECPLESSQRGVVETRRGLA